MLFSELMKKLVSGQPLSTAEQHEMVSKARELETLEAVFGSKVLAGTGLLSISGATIAGGDVVLDNGGIFVRNNAESSISFGTPTNVRGIIFIVSDANGFLDLVSDYVGGGVKAQVELASGANPYWKFFEDPAQSDRVLFQITPTGAQGARLEVDDKIDLRSEGSSGGSTFMRMRETSTTPPTPGSGADAFHMYMKGDKVVMQFNSGGTLHYFYLDLTATTDQHWVYSATAP